MSTTALTNSVSISRRRERLWAQLIRRLQCFFGLDEARAALVSLGIVTSKAVSCNAGQWRPLLEKSTNERTHFHFLRKNLLPAFWTTLREMLKASDEGSFPAGRGGWIVRGCALREEGNRSCSQWTPGTPLSAAPAPFRLPTPNSSPELFIEGVHLFVLGQLFNFRQGELSVGATLDAIEDEGVKTIAVRCLEMGQVLKTRGIFKLTAGAKEADDTHHEVSYDSCLANLKNIIQEQLSALPDDPSSVVKRAVLHSISSLCIFFGKQRTNDVFLSRMIPYSNHRDWILRYAFFESIVDVAVSTEEGA